MGQAFILTALSKAVSTPSRLAFSSICAVASQVVRSLILISFFVEMVSLSAIYFLLHGILVNGLNALNLQKEREDEKPVWIG
jgi:hypothetical protein